MKFLVAKFDRNTYLEWPKVNTPYKYIIYISSILPNVQIIMCEMIVNVLIFDDPARTL